MERHNIFRFMGFYSHADPNLSNSSWDILRTVGSSIRKDWIVSGDFNAIINNAKNDRGRRKCRVKIDEFIEVMEELALIDIKIDKGRKPREDVKDSRLFLKFDTFWRKEKEANDIIKQAWSSNKTNIIEKF
ncbi:hypothetical protein J1N35_017810 [Gossypium stocksii]|uniref:Endonuclease/exonuclease/phosphatase domain-containing protein n=1 Tax=Gossypium stocksii TaxID=47602 RepID=A0A9D3VPQ5_9ROSI|nr:hypothetical protein J1N35_017810 [Gossypium stocksii]